MRGTGRSSSASAAAEPRLEQARRFLLGIGPHLADAGNGAGDLDGARDLGLEIAALPPGAPGW